MPRDSLTPSDWIFAGLQELANTGPQALRAEPLARVVGTTKGSFYWHFKDVPAFQTALLAHWQQQAFGAVVALLEADGSAPDRLRQIGVQVAQDPADAALRAWALSNTDVAQVVSQVDAEREKFIQALLAALGITNEDYSRAAYATLVGLRQTGHTEDEAEAAYISLIDLILALR
ncbi:MAG: TetR/AcrR family transcriptional regulator [Rhodobacteraceae bacterium]|nr:TetR/AcrR family transcriptional regulator [Paracoccaceae bacterium]